MTDISSGPRNLPQVLQDCLPGAAVPTTKIGVGRRRGRINQRTFARKSLVLDLIRTFQAPNVRPSTSHALRAQSITFCAIKIIWCVVTTRDSKDTVVSLVSRCDLALGNRVARSIIIISASDIPGLHVTIPCSRQRFHDLRGPNNVIAFSGYADP
jgi:hypothetical protein